MAQRAGSWRGGGWRALLRAMAFLLLLAVLDVAVTLATALGLHSADFMLLSLVVEGGAVVACVGLTWAFGRFEKRTLADYGLPLRSTPGPRFWQGAGIGLASLSVIVLTLTMLGAARFGPAAPLGAGIALSAGWFALLFLVVALFEETLWRGYLQFTFAMGVGFWPAAALTSLAFAATHVANGGETWIGIVNVFAAGMVFCVLLQRTGNLWAAIGFHAAWDWGESYLYGVADSGAVLPGHLLSVRPAGAAWLSGGSVGPEGSLLCTAVLALTAAACFALFRLRPAP